MPTEENWHPVLQPGQTFVTTCAVRMPGRMEHTGPNCWQGGAARDVPKGSVLTFVDDYMFGSDPGPGFPEFEVMLPGEEKPVLLHAVGDRYSCWGRLVKGWCVPVTQTSARFLCRQNQTQPAS